MCLEQTTKIIKIDWHQGWPIDKMNLQNSVQKSKQVRAYKFKAKRHPLNAGGASSQMPFQKLSVNPDQPN